MTFTEEQLKAETDRCLKCGVLLIVDQNRCIGCVVNVQQIHVSSMQSHYIENLMLIALAIENVKPHAVKRAISIKFKTALKSK